MFYKQVVSFFTLTDYQRSKEKVEGIHYQLGKHSGKRMQGVLDRCRLLLKFSELSILRVNKVEDT
jgi:hypothetical protein